jgi:hypothetical protein
MKWKLSKLLDSPEDTSGSVYLTRLVHSEWNEFGLRLSIFWCSLLFIEQSDWITSENTQPLNTMRNVNSRWLDSKDRFEKSTTYSFNHEMASPLKPFTFHLEHYVLGIIVRSAEWTRIEFTLGSDIQALTGDRYRVRFNICRRSEFWYSHNRICIFMWIQVWRVRLVLLWLLNWMVSYAIR